jgi:Ribbon-helix-helix protein, copG family
MPPHHHEPARRTIGEVNELRRKNTAARTLRRSGPGRPATGAQSIRTFRLSDQFMAKLDSWAARQGNSRSEAIRRLVELGLAVIPCPPNGPGVRRARIRARRQDDRQVDARRQR